MNEINLREWEKLDYFNPEFILRELKKIEIKYADAPIGQKVRNLRTNNLKAIREGREAALFCIGISKYMGKKVNFSPTEQSDFDFVVRWLEGDTMNYTPVQLKELVPEHLNPVAELNHLLSKLIKYTDSSRLIVAIHINRTIHLDISALDVPKFKLAGLYTFASVSKDQKNWVLHGDLLGNIQETPFEYPDLLEEEK
jgi:hypothetical protein